MYRFQVRANPNAVTLKGARVTAFKRLSSQKMGGGIKKIDEVCRHEEKAFITIT